MLGVPASATASSATLVYEEPIPGIEENGAYSLDVVGASAEGNGFVVAGDDAAYTVRDEVATLSPGEGCEMVDEHEVRCPTPQATPDRSVVVFAGDREDRVAIGPVPGIGILPGPSTVEVHGGTGDDTLVGGGAHELLLGDGGSDRILAGEGFDRIDGGPGDDTLDGGAGQDWLRYQRRTRPVAVDLRAGVGGEEGENDELAGIENVVGGRAADSLAGDRGPNELVGGQRSRARDVIRGRGGADRLTGYRLRGGPGPDRLDGHRLACGGGRDLVYRAAFQTRGPYPVRCETVQATFVIVTTRPIALRRDRAVYGIRCARPRCRGRLELRDAAGRLGTARFSVRNPAAPSALREVRIPLARRSDDRIWLMRITGVSAFHRDQLRTRVG